MRDQAPRRCGLEYCGSGRAARPYPEDWRCAACAPSARANGLHPDQVAAIGRANRAAASAAASTTAKEAA